MKRTRFKKIVLTLLISVMVIFISLWFSHSHIARFSAPYLYTSTKAIPFNNVGLVLGTSKQSRYGGANAFFYKRILAAAQLYHNGKVKKLIVSGDNRFNDYNEPKDMREALIRHGVPDSCIISDFAGLRTFDSMIRCKHIFGQDSVTVISQRFHNERAIYIARHSGIHCIGFNAPDVTTSRSVLVSMREYLSRFKCLLDIYILRTRAKHYGEKINI